MAAFCSCGQGVPNKEEFVNEIWTQIFPSTSKRLRLSQHCEQNRFHSVHTDDIDFTKYFPSEIAIEMEIKSDNDTLLQRWNCSNIRLAECVNEDTIHFKNPPKQHNNGIYHLSRPIFSNSGDFAIIVMSYHLGEFYGNGCTYIFKNGNDGLWLKLADVDCWKQ